MDDETKTINDRQVEDAMRAMGTPRFAIHSAVRGRSNRTTRAAAAQHHRLKQYVLPKQHRLVRGRPVVISEEEFFLHFDELLAKARAGILEVRTAHAHRLIDLEKVALWRGRRQIAAEPEQPSPETGSLPESVLGPPDPTPPLPNPVTPVDESQFVGKDYIPPVEGAVRDDVGPEIPDEGLAGGVTFDGDPTELAAIPPAMAAPATAPSTPKDEDEEEYSDTTTTVPRGGSTKSKKKGSR